MSNPDEAVFDAITVFCKSFVLNFSAYFLSSHFRFSGLDGFNYEIQSSGGGGRRKGLSF